MLSSANMYARSSETSERSHTIRGTSCPTETHRPRLYSRDDDLSHKHRHTSPPLEDNPRHRARKMFPDFETSAEVPARGMNLRSWEHVKHAQLPLTGPTVQRDPLIEKPTHQHTAREDSEALSSTTLYPTYSVYREGRPQMPAFFSLPGLYTRQLFLREDKTFYV